MDLRVAFDRLADRLIDLFHTGIARLPEIFIALVVALITLTLARRVGTFTQRIARRTGAPTSLVHFISRAASIGILLLGGIAILYALGLEQLVLSFVASLGIVGLILGFALQDVARQFASGVLLLMLRPFDIGDDIRVKDFQGSVVSVQLLTTVLRSTDGLEILIPNADVYTSPIVNYSRYGLQRGHVVLSPMVVVDPGAMQQRMLARVREVSCVAASPAPDVIWSIPPDSKGTMQADVRFWVDCREADFKMVQSAVALGLQEMVQSPDQPPDQPPDQLPDHQMVQSPDQPPDQPPDQLPDHPERSEPSR